MRAIGVVVIVAAIAAVGSAVALGRPSAPARAATPAAEAPPGSLLEQIREHGALGRTAPMPTHGVIVKRKRLVKPQGAVAKTVKTLGVRKKIVAAAPTPTGLAWDGWADPVLPQVGRIWNYDTGSGQWYASCTGTVVARGIVLTAAHCVYDLKANAYFPNMAFIPGQGSNDIASTDPADVKAPYGTWPAAKWWAPDTYVDGTNGPDWGLIYIPLLDGRWIGDVVGSWPIRTGLTVTSGQKTWIAGYPASGFWDKPSGRMGRDQYACDTSFTGRSHNDYQGGVVVAEDCPMNRGASGGPWLYKQADGSYVIGGVSNTCEDDNTADDEDTYCTPVSSRLDSLLFDGRFLDFWNAFLAQLPTT